MNAPLAAVGGALGLIGGSFVGALVRRWPEGRSVTDGGSQCESCGRTLGAIELIPVASYLVQQGRCRGCGARIAIEQPLAELAGGAAGLLAFALAEPAAAAPGLVLALLLIALAILDWRHLWLPDDLTLPLLVAGLLASGFDGRMGASLLGAGLGFGALEAVRLGYRHLRGHEGLGAGDAKLLGAIGAWLGWTALPFVVLGASLVGLLVASLRQDNAKGAKLPLGAYLSITAWPIWLIHHAT